MKRWLIRLGLVLLGLEAFYLVTGNVLLNTGLFPKWVNGVTHQVKVSWKRAITLYPGHAKVTGFTMQFDDDNMVQMDLSVDDSSVDMSLVALAHRTFKLNRGRATGVSYRMVTKVTEEELQRSPERIAAFPQVPGFAFPPLRPKEQPPKATQEQIDGLWRIQLADVDSTIREVWINEYRYLGEGRVRGSMDFRPMKTLSVGPANMTFEGGSLAAGPYVIFPSFEAKVRTTIKDADVSGEPDKILPALTASVHSQTVLAGLDVISLYLKGVSLKGQGPFALDVEMVDGKLLPGTTARVQLDTFTARAFGMKLDGSSVVDVAVSPNLKLAAKLTSSGHFSTPPLDGESLVIGMAGTKAEAWLSTSDLTKSPKLEKLEATLGEARADDVRPLTKTAAKFVPVIAPAVLGDGPLVIAARASMDSKRLVIHLEKSKLGAASLTGAVVKEGDAWNGAAFGKFDKLPLGLKLVDTKFGYDPIASDGWLAAQYKRCGLEELQAKKNEPGKDAPQKHDGPGQSPVQGRRTAKREASAQ